MSIVNSEEAQKAIEAQNYLLQNWAAILGATFEMKTLDCVYAEMKYWTAPISRNQPPKMAANMKGCPFTALNYVKKLFTDFFFYDFGSFYRPHFRTPLINMLLQKKVVGLEFVPSDFNLLEVLIKVYERLHLKINAEFKYTFAAPTLENIIIHKAIGSGKLNAASITLSPANIRTYRIYKNNLSATYPHQFVSLKETPEFNKKAYVKAPISNDSIVYNERDIDKESMIEIYFS